MTKDEIIAKLCYLRDTCCEVKYNKPPEGKQVAPEGWGSTDCIEALDEAMTAVIEKYNDDIKLLVPGVGGNPDRYFVLCPEHFKPVIEGCWIPVGFSGYADGAPVYEEWECSECHEEHYGNEDTLTDYCPHCGARMVCIGEDVEE